MILGISGFEPGNRGVYDYDCFMIYDIGIR